MPDQTARHDGLGVALRFDGVTGMYVPAAWSEPTHRAFPTDAEALAEIEETLTLAIAIGMGQRNDPRDGAKAGLRALFGTDGRKPWSTDPSGPGLGLEPTDA